MFKKNPFLVASLIFGGLALLFLVTATISFAANDNTISNAIANLFKMKPESFTNYTLGQLAVIFTIPAFIFAYRSMEDHNIN